MEAKPPTSPEAMEDITSQMAKRSAEVQECLKTSQAVLKESENSLTSKVLMVESLFAQDSIQLESFFDAQISKIESIKQQVLTTLKTNSSASLGLLNAHKTDYSLEIKRVQGLTETWQKLNQKLESISIENLEEKNNTLLEIKSLMSGLKDAGSIQFKGKENLGFIAETCLSKEFVISEIGNITNEYMSMEAQAYKFLKEQARDLLPGQKEEIGETTQGDTIFGEDSKKKEEENKYNKFLIKLTEPVLASDSNLHQVRYCFNEVIVYSKEANKFTAYQLFSDMGYQKEFKIFNNCGSYSIGPLVFFFGGEDPDELEVTSSRSFVVDTSDNIGRKCVVSELPRMINPRQEFTISSKKGIVYLISGYDGTKSKDKKVITKCEKFDLRKFRFYEIRDVNYPRQWASSTFTDENSLYLFNGFNFNYIMNYVDKIETYRVNLNDWMSLKFSVLDNLEVNHGIKGFCFPISNESIFVFGGLQDGNMQPNSNFIYDTKKNIVRIVHRKLMKEQDEFGNNSDVKVVKGEQEGLVCSGQFARRTYSFKFLKGEEEGAHYEFYVKTNQHSVDADD